MRVTKNAMRIWYGPLVHGDDQWCALLRGTYFPLNNAELHVKSETRAIRPRSSRLHIQGRATETAPPPNATYYIYHNMTVHS